MNRDEGMIELSLCCEEMVKEFAVKKSRKRSTTDAFQAVG
jgi:hypothetical protein